MKKVCIWRHNAFKNYRGNKKIKWCVCKKCRRDMIDFYLRNLEVFIRSEVKRFASEASRSPLYNTGHWSDMITRRRQGTHS